MKVTLCQFDVHWNSPDANFGVVEEMCSGLVTDLLVLPEMFSTGFNTETSLLLDPLALKTKRWMSSFSSNKLILGSAPHKIKESIFHNSLFAFSEGKQLQEYHKKHLYVGDESQAYTSGEVISVLDFNEWKIGLNICYDLRFPVWSRAQNADVLVYCANWPSARKEHWNALLRARAIENQCYVIGVNRIGIDGNDWEYHGESVVFDYWGNELLNLKSEEAVGSVTIDKEALLEYRTKLPFLKDKDKFKLDV